ncbi:hypothetical protein NE850_24755 [Paraburkholderia sp. USG1]|uniref:hypothetical protein n=1 Tax=Paraburkholderia sp. USG1 TaxID=2952268 RepID=UPI002854EE25|nr:hypothetical protein [Paraburkholderia sp. USG1]MDR8399524.1 hypothetical protein [Paraburkholderia sp. USG1]
MNLNMVLEQLRDPYQKQARIFPGLLTVLPLLVPLLWIFGPKSPVLTALVGLVGGCGAIYALASVARGRGKRLEEKLVKGWGGMPTTLILRHGDRFLDSVSKKRYHDVIRTKLGITVPTPEEEARDLVAADDVYKGATRLLRELTRGKANALLLKENIAYGFHRNMFAMRPVGVFTCVLGILLGLVLSKALQFHPLAFDVLNLVAPGPSGGITLVVSIALLFFWAHFNEDQVKRIGYVYAERLFESLNSLPEKSRSVSGARAKKRADSVVDEKPDAPKARRTRSASSVGNGSNGESDK